MSTITICEKKTNWHGGKPAIYTNKCTYIYLSIYMASECESMCIVQCKKLVVKTLAFVQPRIALIFDRIMGN